MKEIPGFGGGQVSDVFVHNETDIYICGNGFFDWNSNIKGYSAAVKCSINIWSCEVLYVPFTECFFMKVDNNGNILAHTQSN